MTPSPNSPQSLHASTGEEEPAVQADVIGAALPEQPVPIEFTNVSKQYNGVTAVDDASFTIHPGEFHCLAGPNGSGKTTLGRIAVGLERATTGTVTGPTDAIGYGFQSPRFYPSLSVRENLVTFCTATGTDPDSPWMDAITDALRLTRVSHQAASELSGGFQKKLDLAIALAERPSYVWLDEPLGDLDDVSVSRVIALLEAYVQGGGGVIVSTHNFEEFDGVFTHLTVFLDGVQNGTMELQETQENALLEQYREAVNSLYAQRE